MGCSGWNWWCLAIEFEINDKESPETASLSRTMTEVYDPEKLGARFCRHLREGEGPKGAFTSPHSKLL
jgi:hypothetical protein